MGGKIYVNLMVISRLGFPIINISLTWERTKKMFYVLFSRFSLINNLAIALLHLRFYAILLNELRFVYGGCVHFKLIWIYHSKVLCVCVCVSPIIQSNRLTGKQRTLQLSLVWT